MSDVAFDPLRYAQAGEQRIDRAFTGISNRRAGQALQRGDYGAAAGALFGNGDLQGGVGIQNMQAQQQAAQQTEAAAKAAREAELTLRVTGALREVQARDGDVIAAFDTMAPQLTQFGVAPELQAQLRAFIASDASAIDQLERLAGQKAAEWTFRDGGGGDVAAVRQTPTGGIESRLAYNAPERPIVTPYGILLPPSQTGVNDAVGGAPPAAAPPENGAVGTFESVMPGLLEREGGFTPRDGSSGAPANFGINQAANPDVDVRNIDADQATQIYRERYWRPIEEAGVPPEAREAVFDFGVNAGPQTALRLWEESGGDLNRFNDRRRQYYRSLPDYNRYGPQWERRVDETSGGGSQAAPQTPASQAMDVGGGWSLNPMQSPADRRAEQQLELSRNADRRAEDAANRAAAPVRTLSASEVEAMGLPAGSVVQQKPDGTISVVSGTTERFTEGQRTSAAFAYRLQNAARTLDSLAQRGVARPSPAVLAFIGGNIRENALSPSDRQWLQASREWLAPVLRRDTGAAVSAGELETYMATYLPSPTDDPATLRQKAQARRVAEEALRGQAGGAFDQLVANIEGQRPQPGRGATTNAPGLPFNITPQQLQFRQQLVQSGRANVQSPRGSETNPIYVNPADETTSYGNIRPDAWFVSPSGLLLRKPPSNNRRRR